MTESVHMKSAVIHRSWQDTGLGVAVHIFPIKELLKG